MLPPAEVLQCCNQSGEVYFPPVCPSTAALPDAAGCEANTVTTIIERGIERGTQAEHVAGPLTGGTPAEALRDEERARQIIAAVPEAHPFELRSDRIAPVDWETCGRAGRHAPARAPALGLDGNVSGGRACPSHRGRRPPHLAGLLMLAAPRSRIERLKGPGAVMWARWDALAV